MLQLSRKPEAFGRTVLEALAVGRTVLGWNHGGVGELLTQLQPDGAVPPFDTAALQRRAAMLLMHSPELPPDIPYTLQTMQSATLQVYDEALHLTLCSISKPALLLDVGRWAPVCVVVFVAFWPLPGLAATVLTLSALLASYYLIRYRFRGGTQLLDSPAWALTSVLFMAYWLPAGGVFIRSVGAFRELA